MLVAFESNPQESIEFLQTYLSWFLCGVYVLTLVSVLLLYRLKTPDNLKFLKWLYLVILISVVIVHITRMRPSSPDLRYSDMINHIYTTTDDTFKKTYAAFKEYQKIQEQFDSIFTDLQVKKAKNNIDNIVLVIGESTQRGKLSLYGYPLPTTPLLDNLKDSKPNNLFVFSDVISPHAQTHESLSLSLTLANQDSQGIQTIHKKFSKKQWYEFLNIIDAFKLGGYHTISISNQEPVSLFGNAAATILKRADEAIFVNVNDKMSTTKFDESILEILKNEQLEQEGLQQGADENTEQKLESSLTHTKPTFYALHLMGNHAKYYNRYPTNFAHFTPKDMLCQEDNSPQKSANIEENMHYDNATLYGDFILSEIIKRFESSDSIVIYFSDHGEEIYDFRNFIGHSDSKISRFMVEIPFIIYVSDSFIQKHPQLYKRIQKAQNQKYMNDDLMHTLLDIAGISLNGYESQRSLLATNKAFLKSRMRKVGDKSNVKDYDKELKTQKSYLEQDKCSIQGNN